jgi:uncharacterized Zn-binding protein involved in type VI secretion
MPEICVESTAATCGHTQSGSSRVLIGGKGVSRVQTDTAGGLIIGPGSQSVFVEGKKVSLPGDAITTHGKSPHAGAVTIAGQSKVIAGTGFVGDGTGTAPKPDLEISVFAASLTELHCSGTGIYPPPNMQAAINNCFDGTGPPPQAPPPPPTVTYSYTVTNNTNFTAQPFTVGFWRFLDADNAPDNAVLTLDSLEFYPDVALVAEQSVDSLDPGESYSSTFLFGELYSIGTYAFGIYADIYNTTTEPDERNSAPTITITVDDDC